VPTSSLTLPSTPEAASAAREFVREVVDGHLPTETLHDALLLTTELVTNAVRHWDAGSDDVIELEVSADQDTLRVVVRDRGPGFDPSERRPSEEGGWGLFLVERVATRWGVRPRGDATEVWFEIRLAGSGA
jgi:anti-sigma regulatory factor (Ser/Thr protein kinase)